MSYHRLLPSVGCLALVVACPSHDPDEGKVNGDDTDDGEATCASFVESLTDCGVVTGTRLAGCEDDARVLPCAAACVANTSCAEIEATYCYGDFNSFADCLEDCQAGVLPLGFVCNDGSRIPAGWRCDGATDCPNGEDEDCPEGTKTSSTAPS